MTQARVQLQSLCINVFMATSESLYVKMELCYELMEKTRILKRIVGTYKCFAYCYVGQLAAPFIYGHF